MSLIKSITAVFGLFIIIAISPIILGKIGFFENSFAEKNFQPALPPIHYTTEPRSYAQAVKRAAPSVVSVQTNKSMPKEMQDMMRDPFFRHFFHGTPTQEQPSIGSGVIVSNSGHILTNNHVIKDASRIDVKLSDGRTVQAKVIGSDPESDVAILKVTIKNLPPAIPLGNSDQLQSGDVVLAIGSPFGLGNTVSMGIVSATHRNELGINAFENYIQTDAAINPGNSGGPLINADGNMVGINNVIYSRNGGYQGIGFAIPINLAKDIMSELIHQGHMTRGWLGISLQKLTDDLRPTIKYPKGDGVVIAGIMRDGPAHKAGIQSGDVIININGHKIKDPAQLLSIITKLKPKQTAAIAVVRSGQIFDFKIIIGKRPIEKNTAGPHDSNR